MSETYDAAPSPEAAPLSEDDVRAIVRLLADAAATPGDAAAKKRFVARDVAELSGTDYWLWNIARLEPGEIPVAISLIHNLSEEQIVAMADANYNGELQDIDEPFLKLTGPDHHLTRRGDQLFTPEQFAATRGGRVYTETLGFSPSYLFTAFPVPGEPYVYSIMGMFRKAGREAYSARDSRLVHIVFREIEWLHHPGTTSDRVEQTRALPPRLRTVLTSLILGHSPKRAAFHLGIAESTVRSYIREIYARFGVRGRADLMRRFAIGDGGDVTPGM
ncbi:MAG: helix-turn-helix transcriptional regulator [Planctomycetota bacterium]